MADDELLKRLDNIAAALHELAYAQAATAAFLGNTGGGGPNPGHYAPEDFLSGNVRRFGEHVDGFCRAVDEVVINAAPDKFSAASVVKSALAAPIKGATPVDQARIDALCQTAMGLAEYADKSLLDLEQLPEMLAPVVHAECVRMVETLYGPESEAPDARPSHDES